jgi:hypothetical protein
VLPGGRPLRGLASRGVSASAVQGAEASTSGSGGGGGRWCGGGRGGLRAGGGTRLRAAGTGAHGEAPRHTRVRVPPAEKARSARVMRVDARVAERARTQRGRAEAAPPPTRRFSFPSHPHAKVCCLGARIGRGCSRVQPVLVPTLHQEVNNLLRAREARVCA